MKRNNDSSVFAECGCYLFILIANLIFGGASVNYLLAEFVGKTMPIFWAVVVGIFVGQFSIPIAMGMDFEADGDYVIKLDTRIKNGMGVKILPH